MITLSLSESYARTLARLLSVESERTGLPQQRELAREIASQMRGQMMPTFHLRQIWERELEGDSQNTDRPQVTQQVAH